MKPFDGLCSYFHMLCGLEKCKVTISWKVAILINALRCDSVICPFQNGVSFEEHKVRLFVESIENVSDTFKINVLMFTKP